MAILIELALALVVVVSLLINSLKLSNSWSVSKEVESLRVKQTIINSVFSDVFQEIVNGIRTGCPDRGRNNPLCSQTYPFPASLSNNGTNVLTINYQINNQISNRNILISRIEEKLKTIGCSKVSDSSGTVSFTCPYYQLYQCGTNSTLNSQNFAQSPYIVNGNVNFVNPDQVPVFCVRMLVGTSSNNPFLSNEIVVSLSSAYNYAKEKNLAYFNEIANVMKEYHLRRRVEEASNPCQPGGGLNSEDDLYIPWIMQAYQATFLSQKCNTSNTSTCSCTNITWSSINMSNRNNFYNLMTNLQVGNNTYVDFFGNAIFVKAINNYSSTPSDPQTNYSSTGFVPPYIGTICLGETSCVNVCSSLYCKMDFVYPN